MQLTNIVLASLHLFSIQIDLVFFWVHCFRSTNTLNIELISGNNCAMIFEANLGHLRLSSFSVFYSKNSGIFVTCSDVRMFWV